MTVHRLSLGVGFPIRQHITASSGLGCPASNSQSLKDLRLIWVSEKLSGLSEEVGLREASVEAGTRAGRVLLRIVERCQDQNQWHREGKGLPLGYHPQRWCWMAPPVGKGCCWRPNGSMGQWAMGSGGFKRDSGAGPSVTTSVLWSPRISQSFAFNFEVGVDSKIHKVSFPRPFSLS